MRTMRTAYTTETAASIAFGAMLLMVMWGVQQPWPYNVAAAVYYIAFTFRCGTGIHAHARQPAHWPWTWLAAWLLSTGLYGAAVIRDTDNFYVRKAAAPVLVLTAMLLVTGNLRMTLLDLPMQRRLLAGRPGGDNPDS